MTGDQSKNVGGEGRASPKPMEQTTEAAEWLIGFAKTNVEALQTGRPGDLVNLLYDLRRYLVIQRGEEGEIERLLIRAEKEPTLLEPAIAVARQVVEAVADRTLTDLPYEAGSFRLDARKPEDVHCRTSSNLESAVLMAAKEDVTDDRVSPRIRRCKECRTVFFAKRKQQVYCGRECANTVASRKYQEKKKKKGRKAHGKK